MQKLIDKTGVKNMHKDFPEMVIERFAELGITPTYSLARRTDLVTLQDNYFYISQYSDILEISTTGCINVEVTMSTPGVYEDLIKHTELGPEEGWSQALYDIGKVIESKDGYNAIRITLNNLHTLGYYLSEKNTFVFGNIVWHDHYLSIVLRNVWPQILEKLNLR